ncbi:MAG: copper chaperone PCu(A)C [Plesiomonas sp.]|uniref:copper chaperone PCu(A)C n=1 Tax=Plesiomonas sp. TaxID=2486279 RepID=UPI003F2E8CD9
MQKGRFSLLWLSHLWLSCMLFSGAVFANVSIAQPYARATVANANVSAVFLTLFNPESDTRKLVAISTPFAQKAEMHQSTTNAQGVMSMQAVEQITLPAKGTVILQPGGLHIMLLNLHQALPEGTTVPLILTFDNGQQAQVEAVVKAVKPSIKQHQH